MESSEALSVVNQQVHILAGNVQAGCRCQRHGECSINEFTYSLEMRRGKLLERSQCSINKFTYLLEMRKRNRIVRGAASAQSTSSRTSWKWASEMEPSEVLPVLNQQVHVLAGNVQMRWICQGCGQCSINKFTYILECTSKMELSEARSVLNQRLHVHTGMHKRDGIIRGAASAQSTSSRTRWECTDEMDLSRLRSVLN